MRVAETHGNARQYYVICTLSCILGSHPCISTCNVLNVMTVFEYEKNILLLEGCDEKVTSLSARSHIGWALFTC